jgi:RNA polymerase sigma factor (TIGR02999 family)
VTVLLRAWRQGDRSALDELMPLIYQELHRIADRQLRGERSGHTIRPTDLVSEAFLRLTAGAQPAWNDRAHFFAVAARNMRQVLIDHARRRAAGKRGPEAQRIALEETQIATYRPDELVALDDALEALARFDERKARAIELHYFGGLTQDEIAHVLDLHVNTVARDLRLAAAWLHRYLNGTT